MLDKDLRSIQEARQLARAAQEAHEAFSGFSEQAIDKILQAMVEAVVKNAERLARMTVEETGYGVVEHKTVKNLFASRDVYQAIRSIQTVGILKEDKAAKVIEAAVPVGVVLALTPTTNPTSTIIHNAMCAVKAGNAIIFSPHPNSVGCSNETVKLLHDAAVGAGAPRNLLSCVETATMEATNELMKHEAVSVIIATGGSAMVKAAYSAGKPALGVGPGNVPAFIERTADVRQAVKDIVTSKTFDNGMICASEQAIIADRPVEDAVVAELKRQGCYFLSAEETEKVARLIMTPKGGMVASMVGQTAVRIAEKAGLTVPAGTKLLIARLSGYGPGHLLSYEKLTCVLGFYVVNDWHEACLLSIELLKLGGIGHSFSIHSRDEQVIREFIRKPVFRILVNTPSAFGAIGYSTGLLPSLTLGCGTWGGSSISENLGPQHLINIKRLTYGIKPVELEPVKQGFQARPASADMAFTPDAIAGVVRQVLKEMQK